MDEKSSKSSNSNLLPTQITTIQPNVTLRILLLQENRKGIPLFDSTFNSQNEVKKSHMNLKGLHEMLFGTVPLAQQKTTKIHFLKSEHRIFLTKIFSLRLAADHDLLPSNDLKRKYALGFIIDMLKIYTCPPLVLVECELEKLFSYLKENLLDLWKQELNDSSLSPASILQSDAKLQNLVSIISSTIFGLFLIPKLNKPIQIWLEMIRHTKNRSELTNLFIYHLLKLKAYENKNHFLSSVITGCLMYHKTWTKTIIPQTNSKKSLFSNLLQKQLHEAYGNVGDGKLCRLLVIGKNREVVESFLYILSYFVRCSDLQLNSWDQNLSLFKKPESFDENAVGDHGSLSLEETSDLSKTTDNEFNSMRLQLIELDPFDSETLSTQTFSFASSLYGVYSENYCNYYSIMGIPPNEDFFSYLISDLTSLVTNGFDHWSQNKFELKESTCLLIDTDKCSCEALSFNPQLTQSIFKWKGKQYKCISREMITFSEFIQSTLSVLFKLATELNFPAESVVMFLESKLKELFEKVNLLQKLSEFTHGNSYSTEHLHALEIKSNDLQLLISLLSCLN